MKFKLKNTLLALAAFTIVGGVAAGGAMLAQQEAVVTKAEALTAKYTITGTSSVSVTGAPTGATVTYSQTYNTTAGQITKNNSLTLTLSGYDGYTIQGLTLSMKSNASKGAGSMTFKCGTNTIASIVNSDFNSDNWYGEWSTSYVDINPNLIETFVGEKETLVLTINASVNSIYCESVTLSYAQANPIESIELEGIGENVKIYDSGTLSYTALDSSAEIWEGDVTYTTSDDSVIALDGDKWTALKAGTADITVTAGEKDASGNDVTDTISVTVADLAKPLTDISGLDLEGSVYPESVKDLEFTYLPADTDEAIIVTSSDETVLTVEAITDAGEGLLTITCLKEGTATVTVSGAKGEVKATKEITVSKDVLTVSITGEMTKTTYVANEAWDATGLTISASYASGKAYTGDFAISYHPASPALMGEGQGKTLTVYAEADSGEKASIEQTVTVTPVTHEGLIAHGSALYIAATHEETTYYLHSNGTSNAPSAVTDISDATAFIFNLIGDNTYEILTMDGDYLYATNTNNGVRVGPAEDAWLIKEGKAGLGGAYTFVSQNYSRYLTLYNGNDWRGYGNEETNRKENTDVVSAASIEESLETWINNYMEMENPDYEGEGTGKCVSEGTYVAAKAALIALGKACVDAFQNNQGQAYTDALERYLAWAAAAGDATPFAGEGIVNGSHAFLVGSESYKVMTISAIAVLLGIAGVGAMIFIAKKRKKA